jgi:hypothetical protein
MNILWTNRLGGDYTTALDWTPSSVPGPNDDAEITARGTYTVTSSIDETVNSLSTAKGATLSISGDTFTITSGVDNDGIIAVSNASTLLAGMTDGNVTFDNNGTIQLSGGGNTQITATGAFMVAGTATLQGNGEMLLLDDGNQIVGNGSPAVLSNAIHIIGIGNIGDFSPDFTLINQSTGIVDATGADSITFEPGTVVVNYGLLESTNPNSLDADPPPQGVKIAHDDVIAVEARQPAEPATIEFRNQMIRRGL